MSRCVTVTCEQCQQEVDINVAIREGWLTLKGQYIEERLDFCSPDCLRQYLGSNYWTAYIDDLFERSFAWGHVHTKKLREVFEKYLKGNRQ